MKELTAIYESMGISPAVFQYGETVIARLKERFEAIDKVAEYNQTKVLAAFRKNRVSATCFAASSGYGYNDEAFVEATLDELHRTLGLAEKGGAVIPYIYPQDFMRGGTARISSLSEMLKEAGAMGLVVVGAPEGTHRALAALQETELERALYPVISLMPQDDILGIESGSDIVIEYVPASATVEGELVAESGTFQENVPQLIARSAYYLTLLPPEYVGGFQQDLELLTHARQLAGSSWTVSRYIDPETGLCPMNHFVIDRRQG